MTANQVNRILADAGIYYRAFPTPAENDNHRIIKKSVEIIKRIIEYRGATKGAGSLPKELLAVKYEENVPTVRKPKGKPPERCRGIYRG